MNKAFVREPDLGGRAFCPRCGSEGVAVGSGPLDTHIRPEARRRLQESAWFCAYGGCEVAYFNQFETIVGVDELNAPIYPYDLDAPLCACFGFAYDDVEADVRDGQPLRIRQLLAKSQTDGARCHTLAPDGQCCMREVQRLYVKLRGDT
jgi:hypothetical protein